MTREEVNKDFYRAKSKMLKILIEVREEKLLEDGYYKNLSEYLNEVLDEIEMEIVSDYYDNECSETHEPISDCECSNCEQIRYETDQERRGDEERGQ